MPFRVKPLLRADIAGAAALPATSLLLAAAIAGCGGSRHGSSSTTPGAAVTFLNNYVRPNGRVTRLDQGNDTVSEGQAYGLLLAEAAGDDGTFGRIWRWTRDHLRQPNGLFAFHANAAGQVLDPQPASDADLIIAWALLRYRGPGSPAYHQEGRQVANAILTHEVTTGPDGARLLTAGPWATGRPASLNPSYWSLPALASLASLTGNPRWRRLADAAVSATRHLTRDGRLLPSDWAELTAAGQLRSEPAPNGGQPQTQYGLDAQRTVVWFAVSCDPQAKALATRWWEILRQRQRSRALALRPDGGVLNSTPAVLPLVASSAAARAAGDSGASQRLLRRAGEQQRKSPTYYGGAWAALGAYLVAEPVLRVC
ncbi:MAG TPA: glycosyl hydrolase family 8 [Streptosporangiaceae bacterium]